MEELANEILEKTGKTKERFDKLTEMVVDPAIIADNREFKKLVKERARLEDVAEAHVKLEKMLNDYLSCQKEYEQETDHELKSMFYDEIGSLKKQIEDEIEEIKVLLLPKDVNDDSNVIIEIRQAAGGEESALFCNELYRMYAMYAEKNRWKVEVMDVSNTEIGGIKEITFMVKGKGAYSKLKYESGVHRVQRVPETESGGRIHTSTSTVAVLPEIEEVEFEIEEKDLKIDTYRASGAGGQHINKTESAIRITHLPTGIVVACQDERSQTKNKERAMSILRAKLYDFYQGQIENEYKENRKSQVGTGDRSERVRTYNYPQGRCTDHRVNVTSYSLGNVLNGDIDQFIEALTLKDRAEKLANA
ncbi:MAG: peptide chain release factor 1 [Clostridia bacterium]|nr:peptide chain release factor 1 [Clostridia bacterium]MBQ8792743.1 peptide chain release factor 1 [Clostridia bacterium]